MPKTSLLQRLAAFGASAAAVALTFSFIALLASHGLPTEAPPLMALADPAMTQAATDAVVPAAVASLAGTDAQVVR
jgi:hypothetical protein